mmetsp:Transcript_22002/g.35017  ORF Transcript_22002/g.35017 Transcript_22002/m.35017 type:complete len:180 (+) Transcript_22002:1-540(+)
MTYVYDEYVFHYVVEGGICFLAMSDEQNRHRVPFAFLNDVQSLFAQKYGADVPQRAIAFSLNEEFSKVIKERMDYYNSAGSNVDGLSAVKNQIEDVKGVMVENIEKVLERGEKIELLVDKTDRLNQQAFKFESSSRNLRRSMWWKNAKWVAIYVIFGGFVVFFAAGMICGFDFHRCRAH